MYHINAKLGTMRKDVGWTVYPHQSDGHIIIQSQYRICRINPSTRKGMLSRHCSSGAYFVHLSRMLGATEVDIPQDVLDACYPVQAELGQFRKV